MAKCTVLKDFKLSVDGINQEEVVEGDEVDVPERLIPGLKAAGFVEPPPGWTPKPARPKPAAAPAADKSAGGDGKGDKSQAKA
jgi:hypothetical protein